MPRLDQPQYGTARSVLGLLEAVGWTMVVFGLLVALIGFSSGGLLGGISSQTPFFLRILAALPGLGIAVTGLFMVVYGQVGRAQLHTAEYARESLRLMKENRDQGSQADRSATLPEDALSEEVKETRIKEGPDGTFIVEGRSFKSRSSAEDYLEFVARQRTGA